MSKGLKDSTGASAEYGAAVGFLNGLKTTVDKLNEHLEAYPDTLQGKDIAEQAERLKTDVEKFKAKAENFEASLAPSSTKSSFRRAPKKIQWTLFADSIKELQAAILQPQNVLNTILLLQTLYDLPSLRSQDQQPIEPTGHLYWWSGGQISHITGVTTSEYLHSSITLLRTSNGRYFATPGDATPEINWNRPTFSGSMSSY